MVERVLTGVLTHQANEGNEEGDFLGGLFHDLAVFPNDERQAELAVFRSHLSRNATEGALGTSNERRDCRTFSAAGAITVLFHAVIMCRKVFISCASEKASCFADGPRLSQTDHRVAIGR